MKCNKCNDEVTTAADVFCCEQCGRDGTAAQIPEGTPEDAPIAAVIAAKPGLGNRFLGTSGAAVAASPTDAPAQKRKAAKRKAAKRKAPAKK